jgi:hypothetical protein
MEAGYFFLTYLIILFLINIDWSYEPDIGVTRNYSYEGDSGSSLDMSQAAMFMNIDE